MKQLIISILILSCVGFIQCQPEINKQSKEENSLLQKQIFWGDIHNHCNVGYAKGSLERAYDIAQSHLDFYCFTPHTQWHDQPDNSSLQRFTEAYKLVKHSWPKVTAYANEFNKPGEFVSFIGFEWHSSMYGDVCIIMPDQDGELVYLDDIKKLQDFARENDAILVPHHPAYLQGWRGQNWDVLAPVDVSPVIEIFSEHGNAESDRGPNRYIRHSMGGRYTKNTLQYLWDQGNQVGVVASSDDHLGYPGGYGEGLVAVHADTLTRESIMEAIKARRTYAVSADRIELDFRLNKHWMGETIAANPTRDIFVDVKGKDVIDRVEVLRNNEVIYRNHPIDQPTDASSWDKPVLCRIEFGWGAWGGFDMVNIADWKFDVHVTKGKILSATPCFQSGPLNEEGRNLLTQVDEHLCQVTSYTSRKDAYEERATNSIILEIRGSQETELALSLAQPIEIEHNNTLGELAESSDIFFMGSVPSESVMIHRVVFSENYQTSFEFTDRQEGHDTDWYYVRVVQANGNLAWSSPIWVEATKN